MAKERRWLLWQRVQGTAASRLNVNASFQTVAHEPRRPSSPGRPVSPGRAPRRPLGDLEELDDLDGLMTATGGIRPSAMPRIEGCVSPTMTVPVDFLNGSVGYMPPTYSTNYKHPHATAVSTGLPMPMPQLSLIPGIRTGRLEPPASSATTMDAMFGDGSTAASQHDRL